MQISAKVSEIINGFDRFVINGYTVIKRKARLAKVCDVCHNRIELGEDYFELTLNGAGVGGFTKPARVHIEEIFGYIAEH